MIAPLQELLAQANERDTENRRNIAALTSSILALEAPADSAPKSPQAPEPGEEPQGRDQLRPDTPGAQEGARWPWSRRVFGG
jgi:hypothetical protein